MTKKYRFRQEGFHVVHNDGEADEITEQYWGNGQVEITREQIEHLLNGGILVEVIGQEYTSEIKLKE